MRRFAIGLANAMIFFALAACQAAGGTGGKLDGTIWQLESQDVSGSATGVPPSVTVDARFTGNRIAGSGGCNSYTGDATASGSSLAIGPLRSTRKTCEPAILLQEQQFFTAMGNATKIDPSGRMTMLRDDSGAMQVVLSTP